jgi:tryptophan-rich sensory protein
MYNSDWFDTLNKPLLNPPSEVFSPVWVVLYSIMALSVILFAFEKTNESKIKGYLYFSIQLFFNLIWSPVFFLLQNIGFAFLIIVLLDISAILTVKEFYKVSKLSALLLIPYIIWILFATYLSGAYFYLN